MEISLIKCLKKLCTPWTDICKLCKKNNTLHGRILSNNVKILYSMDGYLLSI